MPTNRLRRRHKNADKDSSGSHSRKSRSVEIPIIREKGRSHSKSAGRHGKSQSASTNKKKVNDLKVSFLSCPTEEGAVIRALLPMAKSAADAVSTPSQSLVHSLKSTLDPLRAAMPEGLPRSKDFAAKMPKIERLRRRQEAMCALHFRCLPNATEFNEPEFERMNRAFNSLHAKIKEIYDELGDDFFDESE